MLFDCVFNMWSPKIGDPHVMGWVTVAFYFLAAMQALCVSYRLKYLSWEEDERRNRLFWLVLVLVLIFLGLNKQFDLYSYFTAAARCSAQLGGWYEERHRVQILFIVSIGCLFIFVASFLLRHLRENISHNFWAIIGVSFLLAFIFIRASSFHNFDIVINYEFSGVRMNWILELTGILPISIQSMINLRKERNGHFGYFRGMSLIPQKV